MSKHTSTRILVADDNVRNLAFMQDLLEGRGYEVAMARNGQAAVERALLFSPDLILLDVMMPVLDGLEACQKLKENPETAGIPIIFTTALAQEEEKVKGLRAGAVDYVTKPIAQEELLMRLEVHLKIANLTQELEDRNAELTRSNIQLAEEIELRQNVENQLVRSERFAAVGTMLQGIAHEFNNINGSLQGYTELAMRMSSDTEMTEILEHILKSVKRQCSIIENLLSISGRSGIHMQMSEVDVVIDEALELARFRANRSVHIVHERNPELKVMMDTDQVGQVLLNLLINACDAMADIAKPELRIVTEQRGDEICLSVIDNGCGIAKDKLREIFTPFYTTKGEFSAGEGAQSKIKGSGLGLSVCEQIIHRHRGRLEVQSEVGVGTTFRIYLPMQERKLSAQEVKHSGAGPILVVDDDDDLRTVMLLLLKQNGLNIQIVGAENGKEALAKIKEQAPSLIFLDLNMPVMDGPEFLQELKNCGLKFPIVVLSGLPSSEAEARVNGFEVQQVMSKPVDLQTILKLAQAVQ